MAPKRKNIHVTEKVRCYPFDDKGMDVAFEMVRAYFEKIGMDTSVHSVYEEAKLLTDYYEKKKAEELIQESQTGNRGNGMDGD